MQCEICKRDLPEWSLEEHHLVPREEGGSKGDKIYVCIACHDHLHKKITNKELAQEYNTIEKILSHPEISRFAKWISRTKKVRTKIR